MRYSGEASEPSLILIPERGMIFKKKKKKICTEAIQCYTELMEKPLMNGLIIF